MSALSKLMFNVRNYGTEFPPQSFFEQASENVKYTPDSHKLYQREKHLLFAYGSEQEGLPKHELLGDTASRQFTAFTQAPFCLWKTNLRQESEAIALDPQKNAKYNPEWTKYPSWGSAYPTRIQGIVYEVPPSTIVALDKARQNTIQYERRRVLLHIPYRKEELDTHFEHHHVVGRSVCTTQEDYRKLPAFMYMGCSSYWTPLLDAGFDFSPVKIFTSKAKKSMREYSCFTPLEYDGK